MARSIDARDVLDTNGVVKETFEGHVVGRFRRLGPNSWDDYERVDEDGGAITVHRGVPVMVDHEERELRMRAQGRVVIVRWQPEGEPVPRALESVIKPHDEAPGMGAAAVIVKKLREDG